MPFFLGNVKERPLADLWAAYSAAPKPEFRGDCPLNSPARRQALKECIEAVARSFTNRPS